MYIYLITNRTNHKKYVGKTKLTIEQRFRGHISSSKSGSNTIFHKAIRKYGAKNFSVELLEESNREEYWIAKLNPEYNMTEGGDGGDTSKWIDYSSFKERFSGNNNPFFGRTHNEEFRETHSRRMKSWHIDNVNPFKGKHHSQETKDWLKQKSSRRVTDGIRTFSSVTECGNFYKVTRQAITHRIKKGIGSFAYAD